MRIAYRHAFVAALCALSPAVAWAQSSEAQTVEVQTSTGDSSTYYLSDAVDQPARSPSDQPVVPVNQVAQGPACDVGPSCDMAAACDSCDDGCGCRRWPCGCLLEDLGEAHSLSDRCFFSSRGISAGGYVAQSFTWNPYQPNDRFNGPLTWTDRANEYQLNELYFYAGKAADNEGCGTALGWRVDSYYGTNYRWDTSGGFESNWDNGQFYGLAIPALYGEIAYNDLNIKIGRFVSPVGYYTVGQGNNFFSYIPYTYQYGEPFTHTGVWANYKLSDDLVIGGGVTHGWDNSDNTGNPHAGGLMNATYTIDEQRTLAWVGVIGPEPNFTGVNLRGNGFGYTNRFLSTLVYSNKISDDVQFVLQSDFGTQHDAVTVGNDARWYGLNSYLYWNMTCRCQWGFNAEWFRDQGGFRVGTVLPSFGSPDARGLGSPPNASRTGYDGSFYRMAIGPKYYFTPNLYGRAAFIADAYDGKVLNAGGLRPFDDGTKNHQQVVSFDLVWTY
ncbi:MAG: outer membrane beta-barrel protein [Pirellulaceae bacterium]|nr:outer membrane beta-barrel protein [Pirellulaceae bacterium]